ncbi:MAG: GTP 3',8-cyclase MoaA [Bacteriovoracaceae bacterium]
MHNILIDDFGRTMRKLRVSLLDACNFRCTYCMPESATFSKIQDLLTPDEITNIVRNFNKFGIEEVRLTGGEPTLRTELVEIAEKLSDIPLKSLGITTNGFLLKKHLSGLQNTNLTSMNISLDSLKKERFASIARFDGLSEVIKSIDEAVERGFKVKINTVIMKSNIDELPNFIEFVRDRGIEIRFLELMKIGVALSFFDESYISSGELIYQMRKQFKLKQIPVPSDSTAFKYQMDNGVQVGFIASESQPFCGSCSRLRIDSKGFLRACLMKQESINLRNVSLDSYPQILNQVLKWKPYERVEKIEQPMYQIGG